MTPQLRRWMRLASATCFVLAAVSWLWVGPASATTVGPVKTAWYDNTGANAATATPRPSAAQGNDLEVSYEPAAVTEPQQPIPTAPGIPGAPVAPPQGSVGGKTVGNTLAFAALDYAVPAPPGGQSLDPASVQATLTLTLNSSSTNVSSGDLIACPTSNDLWTAGGNQDSGQAPQYACGGSQAVTGNVDSAGHTVTFAFTPSQESPLTPGDFSVVIVPGSSPSGAFQAVISAPGATSFNVTAESAANSNTNLASPLASGDLGGAGSTATDNGNFGLQSYAPPSGVSDTSGSSAAPSSQGTSPAPQSAPRALGVPVVLRGLGSGIQRAIAVILLVSMGVLLAVGSQSPVRAPRSLRLQALGPVGQLVGASSSTSARTWRSISSRMRRTSRRSLPAGSGSSQST